MPQQPPWQQPHWQVFDARELHSDSLKSDVIVIGSGAGGAVTANVLAQSGLKVTLIEEGPLKTSADFQMEELPAYRDLYQDSGSRMTEDGAIHIFQGKAVGGTTLVNWTSSFRTPKQTLDHWHQEWDFDANAQAMQIYFERMGKRLNISPWRVPPNANNDVLKRGCEVLSLKHDVIPRNVQACWNLGYCGMGCPTNAKQSMLVTEIPQALDKGATLVTNGQAVAFTHKNGLIQSLVVKPTHSSSSSSIHLSAQHYVVAGGAINSPALLLRSHFPDPYQRLGKRTFLHPVNASAALFNERIDAFYGAPQSIYSDAFQWQMGTTGPVGFKLEVPPIHPALAAQMLGVHGDTLQAYMKRLPHIHACIALLRDGFHEESLGGEVQLRDDLTPGLHYPITEYLWEGFNRAYLAMAEIQFAAGASAVMPLHHDAGQYWNWSQAKEAIKQLPQRIHRARLLSAHVMGGCTASQDPRKGVVDSYGQHHQIRNCHVIDGSLFPTSVGANPQLSIYAFALRNAERLAHQLTA